MVSTTSTPPTSGQNLTLTFHTAPLLSLTSSSSVASESSTKTKEVAQAIFVQAIKKPPQHLRGLSSQEGIKKFQAALEQLVQERGKGNDQKKETEEKEHLPPPPTSRVEEQDLEIEDL